MAQFTYPISRQAEDTWGAFRQALLDALGYVQPPQLQGPPSIPYEQPATFPESMAGATLPEIIAGAVMPKTMGEGVASGALGLGMMPLTTKVKDYNSLLDWLGDAATTHNAWFNRDKKMLIPLGQVYNQEAIAKTYPMEFYKKQPTMPKTLYHGSKVTDIKEFKSSTGGAGGPGVYLAENPEKASSFAGKTGAVYPVYSNVRNPLFVTADNTIYANELNKFAREHGYDSLYIPSEGEWVIFNPLNIKSIFEFMKKE